MVIYNVQNNPNHGYIKQKYEIQTIFFYEIMKVIIQKYDLLFLLFNKKTNKLMKVILILKFVGFSL